MKIEFIVNKIKKHQQFYKLLSDMYNVLFEKIHDTDDGTITVETRLSIDVTTTNRFIWRLITKLTNIHLFEINIHLVFIPRLNRISYKFFTKDEEISFKGTILLSHSGEIVDNNIFVQHIKPRYKCLTCKIETNIVTQMNKDISRIFEKLT
jgi:hypothetical protein